MARAHTPMIRQLSEPHRKLVRSILKRDRADLARDEYVCLNTTQWKTEVDPRTGRTGYEVLLENLRTHQYCTEDEAAAMATVRLYSLDLLRRGVARRILYDDLEELEVALSLGTRIDWVEGCWPGRPSDVRYPDVWEVLRGLAASDVEVARAYFGARPRALSGGHRPTVLIYNAVQAVVTGNRRAQARVRPEIQYPDVPDCYRAILRTLCGIIDGDGAVVAAGLERVLETSRRIELHEHEKILCLLAHGLAELAYWVSPTLLAGFDVDRPLPWDAGYYRWLRRPKRPALRWFVKARSPLMRRWVLDLEPPGWWRRGPR